LSDGHLTDRGRQMQRLPLSPRLSAILLAADGATEAALTCALLAERQVRTARGGPVATTTNDALSAIEKGLPAHVSKVARLLQTHLGAEPARRMSEADLRRAILAGYPDRVAWRREPGSPRVLLSSGPGATIDSESGVRGGEFIVALDVVAGRPGQAEARVRMAAQIERDWLKPTHSRVEHTLDENSGIVRAVWVDYYDAVILAERPAQLDQIEVERLLVDAWLARPERDDEEQLLRRARFAGLGVTRAELVRRAAHGARALREIEVEQGLSFDDRQRVDRSAPQTLTVPSGREARLEYQVDGSVTASVKLQELFGLADTPRVGPGRVPVLFALLAPNGRPVQLTKDLRSFWERTYPEVRKELRGRYPKHPWPEDPWSATPTARTKKRGV
jgi:ATP-dependent helicase HrpB